MSETDETPPSEESKKRTIYIVGGIGVAIMLVALDIIPQRLLQPNVPSWVLFIVGLTIALVAGAALVGTGKLAGSLLLALAMLGMATAFLYIAFFGESRHMSGGIPFIPDWLNFSVGRIAFGLFGLLFLAIGVFAVRSTLKSDGD
jgi:hypothetical protein